MSEAQKGSSASRSSVSLFLSVFCKIFYLCIPVHCSVPTLINFQVVDPPRPTPSWFSCIVQFNGLFISHPFLFTPTATLSDRFIDDSLKFKESGLRWLVILLCHIMPRRAGILKSRGKLLGTWETVSPCHHAASLPAVPRRWSICQVFLRFPTICRASPL